MGARHQSGLGRSWAGAFFFDAERLLQTQRPGDVAMRRGPRRTGFTLVELVTVIVILGIVSAAAAGPVLTYMITVRGGAAAARLATDIRLAQRIALGSGLRTWVVFNTGSQSYQIYNEDRDNPGKAGRVATVHPAEQSSVAVSMNVGPFAGVTLSSVSINGTVEIEFDSFGVPYDGNGAALSAAGQVTLSSGAVIVIRPVTGLVEVQ
jgi:prepilin-type N-terminal cleavage/methylation domain-containing protein